MIERWVSEAWMGLKRAFPPRPADVSAASSISSWPLGERLADGLARLRGLHLPPAGEFPTGWKLLFLLELHERGSLAACRRVLRRGMTVVDAGAHLGFYARQFARRVGPRGRVFAFEPHPETFQLLVKNLAGARPACVEAVPQALGERPGRLELYEMTESGRHSFHDVSRLDANYRVHRRIGVDVTTLDDFAAARGISRVDLMKMDVEGHEISVLRGSERTLRSSPGMTLLIEYNRAALEAAGESAGTFLRFLHGHGFRLHRVDAGGRLVPVDADGAALPKDGVVNLLGTSASARADAETHVDGGADARPAVR